MAKDLYTVLGVARDADADTIKKVYRKLAGKLHPDRNPGDAAAEARFKEINHAHDVLADPKKRTLYDEFGEDGLREGFDAEKARAYARWGSQQGRGDPRGGGGMPGGVRLEDIFGAGGGAGGIGDIFGDMFNRGGRGKKRSGRGDDASGEVTIDFAQAVRGAEVQLRTSGDREAVTVRIPPGAEEGSRVRIRGEGGEPQSAGAARGDLLLTIHVRPHAHFRRQGDDLHVELPLTIAEAYAGAKVRVPTIDGSVTMKVPPHTQSGQQLRLRGKGVVRKDHVAGDLYVHFVVRIPDDESPEIAAAIETLAKAQSADPREGIEL